MMNIAHFYDKVNTDIALQKRIMAGTDFQVDAIYENAVKVGREIGYEFTPDEARQFAASLDQIPEEMLDMISAGSPTSTSGGAADKL